MTTQVVQRQIIALGGGGFLMEPDNPLLDRYVLDQARGPRVCFVGTASGDDPEHLKRFYHGFQRFDCRPTHLSLFAPPTGDLETFLMAQDLIYVGGGNTRNLLALWHAWGLDVVFRRAWQAGILLCGVSAGALCWFEQGLTDSIPGRLTPLRGLGFLPGSHCPHYDGEPERRPVYRRLIAEGALGGGLAADDGVGLHFVGETLTAVVSSRRPARAYRVHRVHQDVIEEPLLPAYLGDAGFGL